MNLATVDLHLLKLPLKVPYKLAFGPVTAFDTVIAVAHDDAGNAGFGEATILTGYTAETIESCWRTAQEIAAEVAGLDTADAKEQALAYHHAAPFTVTAVVTAIEMLEGHPALEIDAPTPVPLLAILNATDEAGIAEEIERHLADGYGTIKVKVGFELESDLARTGFIQRTLDGRARIRLDGNQGFSPADGVAFASRLAPEGIELLEQPCAMDDWDAAVAVARAATVPVMLDESIYGPEEIERAAALEAAQFIKLKLMKAGSLSRLADQLELIRRLGMTPVLGNGVASDPGCWMEACVARRHIDNAGEMNGFLKPKSAIFETPLRVENGAMILEPGRPRLRDLVPFEVGGTGVGAA